MDKIFRISKEKELNTVLKISQAVSRTLDLDEILEMSCRMTAQALKADRCSMGLLNPAEDVQNIVHTYRRKLSYPSINGVSFKANQLPHISQKLKSGKIVHLFNTQKSEFSTQEKKLFRQLSLKVFLAVPIIVDRKPLGAFHIGRVENFTPFSPSDINLCRTIANQVGIAIKNANLLQDLRSNYDQQNAILSISKSLFQTLNLQELFNLITQKTCEVLKIDRCSISTFDLERKQVTIRSIYYSKDNRSSYKGKHASFYVGMSYSICEVPRVYNQLRKGRAFVTEDILSTQLAPRARKHLKDIEAKSALLLPLFTYRKLSGVLYVSTIKDYHLFTDSEIKLCQTIANLASFALENIELMQNLQEKTTKITQQAKSLEKQYKEQSVLLEISQAISQTMDLKKLFEIITHKTTNLLEMDRCAVMLIDEIKGVSHLYTIYSDGKHRYEYDTVQRSIKDFPKLYTQLKNKQIFLTSDISQSFLSSKEKNNFRKEGIKSILVIPFTLLGKFLGLLALSTLKEQHNFTEDEIKLCQAIANQLSVAVENARLLQDLQEKSAQIQKQAEALEKQFKEQTILLEISKALSQTLDLKKLFEIVTRETVELLGVDRAVAMIIDQNTGDFLLFTHFSRVKHLPELENYPKSVEDFPDIIEQIKTRQIFRVSDVAKSSLSSREKKYFRERSIKSVLSIPFILEGKLLGVLALNNITKKHVFTESEIKLAQAIANQLSVAIENSRLLELSKKHSRELEKLSLRIINAHEDERKNLAGKLHDVIAQDLTAIKFDLKMCQQTIPEQYPLIKDKLEECEKLATQSLENIRNLTSDLRPPILDYFGLASAIRWYINSFKLRTTLKIKVRITEFNCQFPPEFETTIYRIIQEGLTNVAKHSQAKRVSISLYKKGNYARIIIQDNGVGFELENLPEVHGFGLFRLKENAELLGGKFKIISNKGRGTKLNISLPWKEVN